MPDFSTLLGLKDTFDDDASAPPLGEGLSMVQEEETDFFGGEDFDSGAPMPSGFDEGAIDDDGEGGAFASSSAMGQGSGGVGTAGPGEHMPFDGRRNAGDLVMALAGGDDGEGMFDYFDKGFSKNWAGAEHWKLRKVTRKGKYSRGLSSQPTLEDQGCCADVDHQIRVCLLPPRSPKQSKRRSLSTFQHLHPPRRRCSLLPRKRQ